MSKQRPPLVGITVDCDDPESLAGFWQEFLGYERRPNQPQETEGTFATLFKPSGLPGLHHVTFQQVPEPKTEKARAHLDLFVEHAAPILERMLKAGATSVETHKTAGFITRVMRDPAGNEFCLLGPD